MSFIAQITADVSNFENNIKKAVDSTRKFSKDVESDTSKISNSFSKTSSSTVNSTNRMTSSMKSTTSSMNVMGSTAKKIGGYIAGAFAFTAIIRGLKSFVNTNVEFEQSLANLSSLTGAVGDDLEFYKKQAIEMGAVTTLTASQVSEAFMLIGSAQPQLLKSKESLAQVTKEAITLAEAAGMQLPDAARALTGAMNQFKISADSAAEVINVLAAGSKEGSADINSLNQSLTNVGTVAFSAGLSIQQTVGALETLAENQIKGSEAGTALRGVIMKLQASGLGYASGVFNLSDALKEAKESIESHTTAVEKDARSQEIFGIINTTAGKILMQNVDTYHRLTDAVTGTTTAYDQQATNTSTLSASFKALESAIEAIVLSFSESNGVIKSVVDSLTGMLNNIRENIELYKRWGKVLFAIGATFATVSIAMKAYAIATTAMRVATVLLSGKIALLNTVMLANPFVAVAAAAGVVGYSLYRLIEPLVKTDIATKAVTSATRQLYTELAKEQKEVDKLFIAYKSSNPETDEHRKIKDQIISKYGRFLKGQVDEKGNILDIDTAYKQVNSSLRDQIVLKIKNQRLEALDVENINAQAKAIADLTNKVDQSDRVEFGTRLNKELRDFSNSAEKDIDKLFGKLALITRDEFGVDLMKSEGLFGKNAFDAIRTLINSMKDAESQSKALEIAFAGIEIEDIIPTETLADVDDLKKALDDLSKTPLTPLTPLIPLIPEGSLKEVSEKLKVLYEQLDNATTTSARVSVATLIKEIEAKKATLELELKVGMTSPIQSDIAKVDTGSTVTASDVWNVDNKILTDRMKATAETVKNNLAELNEGLKDNVIDLSGLVSGAITDFAGFLGDAFAGDFSDFGANLLGAVGNFAQQFGGLVIAAAITAESLKALITNPVLALAAGGALVTLGAIVSKKAQSMTSSLTGGGYSSAPSMRSSEVTPSMPQGEYRDSYSSGQVEFKISGDNLVGVLNKKETRRNRNL